MRGHYNAGKGGDFMNGDKNYEFYLCTRLKLVAKLRNAGFTGEKTFNPFVDGESVAWRFYISPALFEICRDYYAEIGAPLPKALQSWGREHGCL